jgi:peptidoglycan/xylan/chitin deacetylase (PgdA/CDA1 family)
MIGVVRSDRGRTDVPVAISFHTERLHDDAVWSRLVPFLDALAARGGRATFFVEPLRARVLGADLADRLEALAGRGHEIAMHTHFYRLTGDPGRTTGFEQPSVFTHENVVRCLDEGLAHLRLAGHQPRGFVAGAWAISDTAFDWLNDHGFHYDCSYRSFELRYPNPHAAAGNGRNAPSRIGRVLELPTTDSLTASTLAGLVKSTVAGALKGPVRYRHLYLHDYDLLVLKKLAAIRLALQLLQRHELVTVGDLASRVGPLVPSS